MSVVRNSGSEEFLLCSIFFPDLGVIEVFSGERCVLSEFVLLAFRRCSVFVLKHNTTSSALTKTRPNARFLVV